MEGSALKHTAYTQIQINMLLVFILWVAGVEVSLLTWRMWDGGLHFSPHSLTATYELVYQHEHAASTYTSLSALIS